MYALPLPGGNGKGKGPPAGLPPGQARLPDTDPRALPYTTSFELSEGFNKGQLHGKLGWSVDQGKAIIGKGKEMPFVPHSGAQVVIIEEGQGKTTFSQASLGFLPPVNETITFIDIYVLPEAFSSAQPMEFLDAGAMVAFQNVAGSGKFAFFDGDGIGSGTWVNLDVPIQLVTVNDQKYKGDFATDWQQLTIRIDHANKLWDVWLNGILVGINLGLVDNTPTSLESIAFLSGKDETVLLDDLSITFANPLFTDTDGDGMPDDIEIRLGLDPNSNDRDGDLDGDGTSNIEEILAGTHPNLDESQFGGGPIIYVDGTNGNDNCNGFHVILLDTVRGPKQTIINAIATSTPGTTIVVLADNYTEPNLNMPNFDLNIHLLDNTNILIVP